jgi:hypothetical protein
MFMAELDSEAAGDGPPGTGPEPTTTPGDVDCVLSRVAGLEAVAFFMPGWSEFVGWGRRRRRRASESPTGSVADPPLFCLGHSGL